VTIIFRWPLRVAPLHLQLSLPEKAKSYGLGTDVDSTFTFLRTRFGIFASDPRVCLKGLQRDPCMSLREPAVTVKSLAKIAHSKLLPANCERYAYEAFMQSLGDLGLHHWFLAVGANLVEDTLRQGEAYLQANKLHKTHMSSHKVESETWEVQPESAPPQIIH